MIHTLKCPSCAAPLDYEDESDRATVRCPFCNNSVVVPEAFRKSARHHTIKITPPAGLIRGTLIGTVIVVFVIAGFVIGIAAFVFSVVRRATPPPPQRPTFTINVPTFPTPPTKSPTPDAPGFAKLLMKFGGQGIGPGLFTDARSIAVDGDGRIYAGDYTGGRIQVFDAEGKFITQWMVDAKMPLRGLAADRRGNLYVVQSGKIRRYEAQTGNPLGELNYPDGWGFDDVAIAADGGLVTSFRKGSDDIVRFDSAGRVTKVIRAAISTQSDRSELNMRVAVDGLGNVYALGTFNDAVFKFTPEGRFVTRFGGDGDQPGQFRAAHAVAVDNQGRVYVSDIKGVQVFDTNGRYLDRFKPEGSAFGLLFNDKNELFVAARTQVLKFSVDNR